MHCTMCNNRAENSCTVVEFKEFERRFKFKPRFKYGWFHLKLYQMFQDLSRVLADLNRGSNSLNSISGVTRAFVLDALCPLFPLLDLEPHTGHFSNLRRICLIFRFWITLQSVLSLVERNIPWHLIGCSFCTSRDIEEY